MLSAKISVLIQFDLFWERLGGARSVAETWFGTFVCLVLHPALLFAQSDETEAETVNGSCSTKAGGRPRASAGSGEMRIQNAAPLGLEVRIPAATLENDFVVSGPSGSQIASHGLLTYFWLTGFQGTADLDGDGTTTASEHSDYLTDPTDGVPYCPDVSTTTIRCRRCSGRTRTG